MGIIRQVGLTGRSRATSSRGVRASYPKLTTKQAYKLAYQFTRWSHNFEGYSPELFDHDTMKVEFSPFITPAMLKLAEKSYEDKLVY